MIGKTISHYKILEQIGGGGMGVVYKAEDTKLKRTVALKFLPPDLTRDVDAKTRFVREARAASALQHHNICTIHEIDETPDGHLFIGMDCYDGETLKDKIATGPLPIDEALNLTSQVCEGLSEAHKAGVVHRDIKPANVMVTGDGVVKILDFGLAKLGTTRVTKEGTTMGTVAYMSPEQALGGEVDGRSDIFSLGVMLYELLAGEAPFKADQDKAMLYQITHHDPTPLTDVRPDIPDNVQRVVEKAMEKDIENRYQNVGEFLADLRRTRNGNGAGPKESVRHEKGSRRWLGPVIAGGVVIVVALVGLNAFGLRDRLLPSGDSSGIESLAVLPFDNMTRDDDQAYFVDGMHEALITGLSRQGDLMVISRTSVMRYRDSESPIPTIAEDLNVDGIIEGSVLRDGDRVRISVHLVDADTDRQLWAQDYERDFTEILDLQREVAKAIVGEIQVSLATTTTRAVEQSARPVEPAALEAYLKGRHHWNRRTTDDMLQAVEEFEHAIDIDPDFAEAFAGLADTYAVMGVNANLPPDESFPLARDAAERALELNHSIAEAYVSLAFVTLYYDHNLAEAQDLYDRALELDPNYAVARQWYAMSLEQRGLFEESVAEIERARMLDPLSPIMNANVARRYAIAGRYDDARAAVEKALELDPNLPFTIGVLAEIHLMMGNLSGHIEALAGLDLSSTSRDQIDALQAVSKDPDAHWQGLQRFYEDAQGELLRTHPRLIQAVCLVKQGKIDEAFDMVNRGIDHRDSWVLWIKTYPLLAPLRAEDRYEVTLQRIGLEP